MGKYITPNGPIHLAVLEWMEANSIDKNLVRSYTLKREDYDAMWITLEMYVNDARTERRHYTCIEVTSHGDLVLAKRSWVCGPDCPSEV